MLEETISDYSFFVLRYVRCCTAGCAVAYKLGRGAEVREIVSRALL